MDWLNQLERNRRRGSRPRCVLLMDGGREQVAGRLTRLVGPQSDVVIGGGDRWMPFGKPVQREDNSWDSTPAREARLDGLTALFAPDARCRRELGDQLRKWWLAVPRRANTPNWDVASTCTIKGQRGLLLVEAKAHSAELGESDSCGSRNRGNRERIRWAITEAAVGLQAATGGPWELSPLPVVQPVCLVLEAGITGHPGRAPVSGVSQSGGYGRQGTGLWLRRPMGGLYQISFRRGC